ncbi:Pantoate kinase [Candidatus Methanobinarius endosymbioticus]|uniref:Pantoate kinase n=1 Tax=Candidatus Methanobinarius endosymbioticus TaxID=2006182 RepID=A0A366MEV0_9EURY|nr:Pantoate kinase [Candidatus Methanobinarius endosymbioticus]
MSVSVFIPSHITGFFSIKNDKNPLKKGSCGTGVLIDKGVTTQVKSTNNKNKKNNESTNNFINIFINGQKDTKNEKITLKTIQIIEKQLKLKIEEGIRIEHYIDVPIGAGFGTSASCALGTAIGISKYFNLNISKTQMEQIAHLAEISLGSGLGDILSQTSKGVVIREFPGAPGIGKTKEITKLNSYYKSPNTKENNIEDNIFEDLRVITKTFGEIDTSSIIQNPKHQSMINKIGLIMQKKIIDSPTIENFLDYSYEFAIKTNLMSKQLLNTINDLNNYSIKASMAMLGNTIFAITNKENLENIRNIESIENIKNVENNNTINNFYDFEIYKIHHHGRRIY